MSKSSSRKFRMMGGEVGFRVLGFRVWACVGIGLRRLGFRGCR